MAPECGKPTGSLEPNSVLGLLLSQDNFQGEGLKEGVYETEFGEYTSTELGEFGVDVRDYEFVGDSDQKTCEATDDELGVDNDGDNDGAEDEEEVIDDRTEAEKYRELYPDIEFPDDFDPKNTDWLFEDEEGEEEEEEEEEVISGCMDPKKENYNPLATEDDGSCIAIKGCTDPLAPNYNANAEEDDGSCTEPADPDAGVIVGCMNSSMDNYDSKATEEDPETIPLAGGGYVSISCIRTGCRDKKACQRKKENGDPEKGCFDPMATHDYTHYECKYDDEEETEVVEGVCPKFTDKGGYNSKYGSLSFTKFQTAKINWKAEPYCCVDDDGSDGNMKWKWVYNNWTSKHKDTKKNQKLKRVGKLKRGKTQIYFPEPTSLSIAKKYWRDKNTNTKCGLNWKTHHKMGLGDETTAEICVVHWTGGHTDTTLDAIDSLWGHLQYPDRDWGDFGYNWVILGNGEVQQMGVENPGGGANKAGRMNGAGIWNPRSIHINHVGGKYCHPKKEFNSKDKKVGKVKGYKVVNGKYEPTYSLKQKGDSGKPENMPTKKQMNTLMDMVDMYHVRYPNMKFTGHHNLKAKECPGYNFPLFLNRIGGGYEKLALRAPVGPFKSPTLSEKSEALTGIGQMGTEDIYYHSDALKDGFGEETEYEKRAWAYAEGFKGRKPPGDECFFPKTKITMANSRSKNIENIKVGDLVKSYNTDTNEIIKATVTNKFYSKNIGDYYIINNNLKVTGNHPFWVNNKWKEVKKLKIGDELLNLDGSKTAIKSIELKYDDDVFVHNFEVDKVQNYFAGSYLVHNKPPFPSPDLPDNSNDTPEENNTGGWKDMDCDEFTVFVKDLNKKHALRGYMAGLEKDDRDDFKEKAYTCS